MLLDQIILGPSLKYLLLLSHFLHAPTLQEHFQIIPLLVNTAMILDTNMVDYQFILPNQIIIFLLFVFDLGETIFFYLDTPRADLAGLVQQSYLKQKNVA